MTKIGSAIAIKGGYGLGNFGDDALMVAVYEAVKTVFNLDKIILVCHDEKYIQKLIPGAEVIPPNRGYKRKVKFILYGGGTQFYSFSLTAHQRKPPLLSRVIRNLQSPASLVKKTLWKIDQTFQSLNNPRVAAIGIGLGPFVDDCHRKREAKRIIENMVYIAVRDSSSFNLCSDWSCSGLSLRSDLCYLPSFRKKYVSNTLIGQTEQGNRIGIIVRDWPHTRKGDEYSIPLLQVAERLRSTGKEVEFLSFSKRADTTWCHRLNDISEKLTSWDPNKNDIKSFLEFLSGFDVFISARYHGAVFASILGKPVVCIDVEQKLQLIADLFGESARLWSYPFSVTECIKSVLELERDYSKSKEGLASVVRSQGCLAEKMIFEARNTLFRDQTKPTH